MNVRNAKWIVSIALVLFVIQFVVALVQNPNAFAARYIVESAIFIVYSLVFTYRILPRLKHIGNLPIYLGLFAGFVISIAAAPGTIHMSRDIIASSTDQQYALWGYYVLFIVFVLVGLISSAGGKWRRGVGAAIVSALFCEVVWVNLLFLVYFVFLSRVQEGPAFEGAGAPGPIFRAYAIRQHLDDVFYFLIESIVVATVLGSIGVLAAKIWAKKHHLLSIVRR